MRAVTVCMGCVLLIGYIQISYAETVNQYRISAINEIEAAFDSDIGAGVVLWISGHTGSAQTCEVRGRFYKPGGVIGTEFVVFDKYDDISPCRIDGSGKLIKNLAVRLLPNKRLAIAWHGYYLDDEVGIDAALFINTVDLVSGQFETRDVVVLDEENLPFSLQLFHEPEDEIIRVKDTRPRITIGAMNSLTLFFGNFDLQQREMIPVGRLQGAELFAFDPTSSGRDYYFGELDPVLIQARDGLGRFDGFDAETLKINRATGSLATPSERMLVGLTKNGFRLLSNPAVNELLYTFMNWDGSIDAQSIVASGLEPGCIGRMHTDGPRLPGSFAFSFFPNCDDNGKVYMASIDEDLQMTTKLVTPFDTVTMDSDIHFSSSDQEAPAVFWTLATNSAQGRTDRVMAAFEQIFGDSFERASSVEAVRVSVDDEGRQAHYSGDHMWGSSNPSVSADGRFVVFSSFSDTLTDKDTNGLSQIYLHDRATRETICFRGVTRGNLET